MLIIGISCNNSYYSKQKVKELVLKFPQAHFLCSDEIAVHNYRALGIDPKNSFADFRRKVRDIQYDKRINFKQLRLNKRYREWVKKFYLLYKNNKSFKLEVDVASINAQKTILNKHNVQKEITEEQINISMRFMIEELASLCFYAEKNEVTFAYHQNFPIILGLLEGRFNFKCKKLSFRIVS